MIPTYGIITTKTVSQKSDDGKINFTIKHLFPRSVLQPKTDVHA